MNQNKKEAYIFDLDHTILNNPKAYEYADKKDWDNFHKVLMKDPSKIIDSHVSRIAMNNVFKIIITGRSEITRIQTHKDLLHQIPSFHLIMRPIYDRTPAYEFKKKCAKELLKYYDITASYDDDEKTRKEYDLLGIPSYDEIGRKYSNK